MKIQFCKIQFGPAEEQAVLNTMRSGWVVMGKKTQQFEEEFAKYVGAKHAVFVDSCTSALDLSVKYLLHKKVWKKGRECSVPSLTFTATAEVLVNNGLKPKFIDVEKDTFCGLDADLPVNLTGNRALLSGSPIVDSAHRIMRNDIDPNDIALWCYSFYATKNMTTIQGGMIATNDDEAVKWLKLVRDHGVSKGTTERYKDGAWDYDISFIGWRKKSDDVHAAIGLEQLKKLDFFNEERDRVISRYNEAFSLRRTGLHLYPILVNDRSRFIDYMKHNEVQVSVHFLPLHLMTAYKKYAKNVNLPNTTYLGERLVSLPLHPSLTNVEVDYIADLVLKSGLFIKE